MNVSNPKPTLCINDLVAASDAPNGYTVSNETMLAAILHTFESLYGLFMSDIEHSTKSSRFEPFLPMYYKKWLHR